MLSYKSVVFSLFLFWSLIYELQTQMHSFPNSIHNKRPNYGLINESVLGLNDNQFSQSSHSNAKPFDTRHESNQLRPNLFNGYNNYNSNNGYPNQGPKRLIPIGGFAPNHYLFSQSYGQNGYGFGQNHMPYNHNPHIYGSNHMVSHLMPHTFHLMNSLRAGLNAGIPSYGYGYGVINDGFIGHPFSPPFRTGSPDSEDKENNEKISAFDSNNSKLKANQRSL